MAENVHLFLKANGKDIKGESTQKDLDRADSIECLHYEQEGYTPFEASTGQASGRRQYKPLVIRKRIDASTPLLWQAMTTNQKVEGEFRFYRPNPAGDGTTEQFYAVEISKAFIASIKQIVEDTIAPGQSQIPPMEEITFIFHDIVWTYKPTGASHKDSWAGR